MQAGYHRSRSLEFLALFLICHHRVLAHFVSFAVLGSRGAFRGPQNMQNTWTGRLAVVRKRTDFSGRAGFSDLGAVWCLRTYCV